MLKHILTIIKNEKAQNIGLWLELLLVTFFLWFVVDSIYLKMHTYNKPLGFDILHTYVLTIDYLPSDAQEYIPGITPEQNVENLNTILDRVQHSPLIEAAAYEFNSRPNIGSNRSSDLFRDSNTVESVLIRMATPDFFKVYRYESVKGGVKPLVEALTQGKTVMSEHVAEQLFPHSKAVGEVFYTDKEKSDPTTVGAIAKNVRYSRQNIWDEFIVYPFTEEYKLALSEQYLAALKLVVRVKAGEDHDFVNRFQTSMSEQFRVGNYYLKDIYSSKVEERGILINFWNDLKMKSIIAFFLLVNILLGVSGIFWFRTQARRSEIGLRVSMGDTPRGILAKYFTEGLIILYSNLPLILLVAYYMGTKSIINTYLLPFNFSRIMISMGITYLILSLTILLGVWMPAHKALKVSPAETLRDE